MKKILVLFIGLIGTFSFGQVKVLFDATKAEMAGNADWVIDADTHNIGFSNRLLNYSGTESNPQRYPTPDQSLITSSTSESYWTGGISAWGIEAVKAGAMVETLPIGGRISYGDTSNEQDLSNYDIYVIVEPNWLFTDEEKKAIYDFVYNGGGLFLISDHEQSDRDGDGYDSVDVWDDFLDNGPLGYNPFGVHVNNENFTESSEDIADLPGNPILYGKYGEVTRIEFYAGTTFSVDYTENQDATALVFRDNNYFYDFTQVMIASSVYGTGKVLFVGDSSIVDDGTGDSGDTLYDGWIEDANGNHRILIMNAMVWMRETLDTPTIQKALFHIFTNGDILFIENLITTNRFYDLTIYDLSGRSLKTYKLQGINNMKVPLNLPASVYIYVLSDGKNELQKGKIILE